MIGNLLASSYSTTATSIASATTTTGQVFDCKTTLGNYTRGVPFSMLVTAIGGTSPTLTFSVETSDTSVFTVTRETFAMASQNAVGEYFLTVASKYRYFRVKVVSGGTNPTATVYITIVQSAQ
jgi:hypothetical protein